MLHAKKSVVLMFRSKWEVDSKVDFTFGRVTLEVEEEYIYLGFKFSALKGVSRYVEDRNLRG